MYLSYLWSRPLRLSPYENLIFDMKKSLDKKCMLASGASCISKPIIPVLFFCWLSLFMVVYGRRLTVEPDLGKPISIYEVHLGSWRRKDDGSYLSYRNLADW